jgi:subtilisin family serine protease
MKTLKILARASLLTSIFALHAFAGDQYLVRVNPSVIDGVAKQHRVKVNRQLANEGIYLITVPNAATLEALKADPTVQAIQANSTATLPELSGNSNLGKRRIPHVTGGTVTVSMPGSPFSGYTNQKPNSIIRLQQAQNKAGLGSGGLKVGVIDTFIDRRHAVLQNVVDSNVDFVFGANGTVLTEQETTPFVDQETTPFVDQETTPFVDGLGAIVVVQQETTPFVDQETTPFVDQETTPFVDQETTPFVDGTAKAHGTEVAGLIHLVAPNVRIVPLRAFRGTGKGEIADIIRAITYARNNGIKVLNMSFSTPSDEPVLAGAIADALADGIIVIASVSNQNVGTSVYPAAYAGVIAVAATDQNNQRASFSNFGPEVDIAAPGLELWTTYTAKGAVNTRYAAVSGTSFSTAYVTGAVALLRSQDPGITAAQAQQAIEDGAGKIKKSPELNADELDVFKTVK